MRENELEAYLSKGVERIVRGILRASAENPKESLFMARYAVSVREAGRRRTKLERKGEHIPPFLIASITSACNLHCQGCYARANASCTDGGGQAQLTAAQWGEIFCQAGELGVAFILLAGGEPLLRRDVLAEAGRHRRILFPVFTNGTMLENTYIKLFDENRNLIPILSIEGAEKLTDQRRGDGVYAAVRAAMGRMAESGILFGASVTVTKENMREVLSEDFTAHLARQGCRAVIYVEYVPADKGTGYLAPGEAERAYMEQRIGILRESCREQLFLSFPGDEKSSGGCLAAGRGFFRINAEGGAEPCPFSPFSDTDLLHTSLREALRSPFFVRLRTEGLLTAEHTGGCVLFEQEQAVKECL